METGWIETRGLAAQTIFRMKGFKFGSPPFAFIVKVYLFIRLYVPRVRRLKNSMPSKVRFDSVTTTSL